MGRIWSRGESQQRWRRRHFIVTRRGADNGLAGLRKASRHGLGAHLHVALKARGLVTRRCTEVLGVDGGQVEQRAVAVVSSGRGPCLLASRRGMDGAPVREAGLATASCGVRLPIPSHRTPSFKEPATRLRRREAAQERERLAWHGQRQRGVVKPAPRRTKQPCSCPGAKGEWF